MLRDESNTGGSRKRQRIRGRGVFCFCGKREEDLKKTKNQELRQSPSEACASWTVEAVNRQESLEFFAWAAPLIGKTVYHTGCCFLSMVNSRGLRASALLSIVSLDNNNNNNKLSWRLLQWDPGLPGTTLPPQTRPPLPICERVWNNHSEKDAETQSTFLTLVLLQTCRFFLLSQ